MKPDRLSLYTCGHLASCKYCKARRRSRAFLRAAEPTVAAWAGSTAFQAALRPAWAEVSRNLDRSPVGEATGRKPAPPGAMPLQNILLGRLMGWLGAAHRAIVTFGVREQEARVMVPKGACGIAALVLLLAAFPAHGAETLPLGSQGVTVTLPDGWHGEVSHDTRAPNDPGFSTLLTATCETENCKKTKESCNIWVYDELIETIFDGVALAGMFATEQEKIDITRIIVEKYHVPTETIKPLEIRLVGITPWYTIEVEAPGYQSIFYGRTIYYGRYLIVDCRTCVLGDNRFDAARDILNSIAISKD